MIELMLHGLLRLLAQNEELHRLNTALATELDELKKAQKPQDTNDGQTR